MRWTRLLGAVSAFPLVVGVARAHELPGGRFDAPLPLPLLFAGAGVTVAATAAWLARAESTARTAGDGVLATASLASPRTGRLLLRAVGIAGFGGVVYYGLTGPQASADNPATLFAWAVALKGVGVVSVLFGSPWRALSPWRTVHAALEGLEGGDVAFADYPDWLGVWPAVAGFVALVGVAENLTAVPQSPRLTAGLLAAYAAVMVAGGITFGRRFFEHADALEVLYALLGRVAVLEWREQSVAVRRPGAACARPFGQRGLAAFVVAAVYTVSFDGFANTPEYQTVFVALFDVVGGLTPLVLYGIGLLGFLAAYSGVAVAVDRLGDQPAATASGLATTTAFAPTVVPIAAAYEVAHNYPFVARNLSHLLSMGGGTVDLLGWLPLPAFWWSQVVLIVVGHILAVVAAHHVAVRRYGDDAARAHLPLVALMVAYTVLSLWIVSRPVVA